MKNQWTYALKEDEFTPDDIDVRFGSHREAYEAGEEAALRFGYDSFFVGRVEWLDFKDLSFPDDIIAADVVYRMVEAADDMGGSIAEEEFRRVVSLDDLDKLGTALHDAVKTWCDSLREKGCFVVEDIGEFIVRENDGEASHGEDDDDDDYY